MTGSIPINMVGLEDAFFRWVTGTTGLPDERVRFPASRDKGPAKGPAPSAEIRLLTQVDVGVVSERVWPQTMTRRHTVIAGAGEVGIDFYPGDSLTPQRISVVAGAGDDPAVTAAALLVEFTANLPAPYTAALVVGDPTTVEILGTVDEPVFASAAAVPALLSVKDGVPRFPYLSTQLERLTWRITFRAPAVNGDATAGQFMSMAKRHRKALHRMTYALGWSVKNYPASEPSIPTDRRESTAVLDVALLGNSTGAMAATPLRALGTTIEAS